MSQFLDTYTRYIRQSLLVLLVISLGMGVATYFFLNRQGSSYEVHFSYLVSLEDRASSSQYQFDGYYALQAVELFTKTLASWITTPELIVEAYQQAHVILPGSDSRHLQAGITATQAAPQLVEVTVKNQDRQSAEGLAKALQKTIEERVKVYQQQGTPAVRFIVVPTTPWTGKSQLNILVIVTTVILFTFFIGINIILLWAGLKRL